ncbi:hypothetical protein ACFOOP_06830 [Marinicaulis aureus]|uniref:Uncharacterized protein n=1 Tax=Hyphococcus aureus TaxID=2666033 RepID=A0ABW1KWY9_9PROT
MASIPGSIFGFLSNSVRLLSPRSWRLIYKQVRHSLDMQGAAFLTASSLFTVGADIVQAYSRVLWSVLALSVAAIVALSISLVSQHRPKAVRKTLVHVYLASFGALLTASSLIILGGNDENSNVAAMLDRMESIDDSTSRIDRTTKSIREDTSVMATTLQEMNVSQRAKDIAELMTFTIDEQGSGDGRIKGAINWPPGVKVKERSCKFIEAGDNPVVRQAKVERCADFEFVLEDGKDILDLEVFQQLTSAPLPWLQVELRDGQELTVPSYMMTLALSNYFSNNYSAQRATKRTKPEDYEVRVSLRRNAAPEAQVYHQGKPAEGVGCRWGNLRDTIEMTQVGQDPCRVTLSVKQNPFSDHFALKEITVGVSDYSTGMSASLSHALSGDELTALADMREKEFVTTEPYMRLGDVEIKRVGYERVELLATLVTDTRVEDEFINLNAASQFSYPKDNAYLYNQQSAINNNQAQGQTIIGGTVSDIHMVFQQMPAAFGYCTEAAIGKDRRMTIEVWELGRKGFAQTFLKTYALAQETPSRGYNKNELSCSNTLGWPAELHRHIKAGMEPPEDFTVDSYRKTLVKKCLNAPSAPEDLVFCVRNGKLDFSRVDFFSPMQLAGATDYNLLTCANIHRSYLEVMRSLSGKVSLPPIEEPPSCEIYGRAAVLFKESSERNIEGAPVQEKNQPFVPYHETAQTCRSAQADNKARVAACSEIFGTAYWLESMGKTCANNAGDYGDRQYLQSLQQQLNSLQATFGDKAMSHGGNQYSGLAFRHGLEHEAFDWYKSVLENEPCPGVVFALGQDEQTESSSSEEPAARRRR